MLVFIDESGDTGLRIDKGSSRFFVIALVSFEENDEALGCDKRIELLKQELKFSKNTEFKFSSLRKDQRITFLKAVLPYSFFYFGIVINKDPKKLFGEGFKVKESFYKYTCSLVFENARTHMKSATVVIDGSGSRAFKQQFKSYLKMKAGEDMIKDVKIQTSHSNNLIQLADMVAGSINRSFTNKSDKDVYRAILKPREIRVQMWPN